MAGTTLRRILLWVVLSVPSLDAYSQIVLRRNPLLEHSAPPVIILMQIPTATLHPNRNLSPKAGVAMTTQAKSPAAVSTAPNAPAVEAVPERANMRDVADGLARNLT